MNLLRWEPFNDLDRDFNRMLRASFWPHVARSGGRETAFEWSPKADISETEKEYVIRAELPAVKKEDVRVTLDNGMLTIEGERKRQWKEKTEKYHRAENVYGNFMRSFSLPDAIDADAIRCEDRDGVLTVRIPKTDTEKSAPKQIRVE